KGGGPKQRRIMELNPKHEILEKMERRFEQSQDDPLLDDYAQLLFGYGLLSEGAELPEPVKFNRAVADLMARGL
ncbi:MAG TPA: molecular chaperone HtpG, partial [Thermoanaerobaculia bacterium]|nr:molecular chaperone HtpG [Thermoanaerobaculia bacterium]